MSRSSIGHLAKRLVLFVFLAGRPCIANDEQELLVTALQGSPHLFEPVELGAPGTPVDFEIELGRTTLKLETGDEFDGFRFTAPENAGELDFVWYFNAPETWAHWYLCPVRGEFEPSFRNWLEGDKVYEQFDEVGFKKRARTLQTLKSGFFTPGEEYIMWFRRVDEGGGGRLAGRFLFAKSRKAWDHKAIEEALALKPRPAAIQVEALNSKGGRILLDADFFERGYAESRIDDLFFDLRQTRRMKNGFFITVETAIPPCKTEPSFAKIRERYGEPDFVQSGEERNRLARHAGGKADEDPDVTTCYFDYFGFEVGVDDPKQKVLRVVTHAHDLSTLKPGNGEPSFGQAPMKNLTVFHKGGKEVGRMYFFLEGEKEPLCIQAPPPGRYERGSEVLEYFGDEKWLWISRHEDGSVARRVPLADHKMHGKAEGFHPGGAPSFVAEYEDGALEGKVLKYSESGEVLEETIFRDGVPVALPPAASSESR